MSKHILLGAALGLLLAAGCGGGSGVSDEYCGDGVAEGLEECDGADLAGATCESLNLGGGELACDTSCRFVVRDCEEQADCGNGVVEYPEECDATNLGGFECADLGFAGGTLACSAECSFDTAACEGGGECGNDQLEPGEECDGADLGGESCETLGLGAGSLACNGSCHFDVGNCEEEAVCGNGGVEYPEVCDGSDLDGASCTDVGFYAGDLACSPDCESFDTSGCVGTCGDGEINGPESCDATDLGGEVCESLGFYPGQLACLTTCDGFDTTGCGGTCGDGVRNGPENCDGSDFGADDCVARGFYSGSLVCGSNCLDVDDSGCTGFCGDGQMNGPEACDGLDVGGFICANGADARCSPDCSEIVCNLSTVLLVEIATGNPDWVELLNVSSGPVNLQGWVLEWQGYDNNDVMVTGQLMLPDYPLAPGERVVVLDEFNGDGSPPTVSPGEIQFHDNIWWGDSPGSVLLIADDDTGVDFVRWGGPDFSPPTGVSWSDGPDYLPGSNDNAVSLSRNPEILDTDSMADWCQTYESQGLTNEPCPINPPPGALLITEVDTGQPIDRVELYNSSGADLDLQYFAVLSSYQWWGTTYLPPFILTPGAYVAIIDDCTQGPGVTCPQVDGQGIHVENINWASDAGGFCALVDSFFFEGVDFVRWGGDTNDPPAPDTWTDGANPPPAMPNGTVIGRSSLVDTDSGDDWCVMSTDTFGAANATCQ